MAKGAENARNYSQCDSLLIGDKCGAHTFPVIDSRNRTAVVEHEATRRKFPTTSFSTAISAGFRPRMPWD